MNEINARIKYTTYNDEVLTDEHVITSELYRLTQQQIKQNHRV